MNKINLIISRWTVRWWKGIQNLQNSNIRMSNWNNQKVKLSYIKQYLYNEQHLTLPDVWLTVHCHSMWRRNQLDVTFVLFFISTLQVAQHVSGNHVPIFRSWQLHSVIATCWCCAVTVSGIIQVCPSVWVDVFYVCLVYGRSCVSGYLIIVCRCVSVCKQIKVRTRGCRKAVRTS